MTAVKIFVNHIRPQKSNCQAIIIVEFHRRKFIQSSTVLVELSKNWKSCPSSGYYCDKSRIIVLPSVGLVSAEDKAMKIVANKVKRSGVYYLMTTVASVNEPRTARLDTWGAVAVVVLLLGVVGLMRLVLAA
jgi:hypothetical protein